MFLSGKDGNCSVYRNVGKSSTFDTAYSRMPNLYIKLQSRKPEDKNSVVGVFKELHCSIPVTHNEDVILTVLNNKNVYLCVTEICSVLVCDGNL
jgi:hypothetical protein